ncbi:hypothetical protein F2Q69_00017011 [Brassica cretica]|uniref:Uncharacterized protein n=1 Tax=Brassica cretica TaxID=69181 RepID=A0A8S9QVF1_BRACR|nr:hypothetical protein F2Q69_00017011 [Brassica cretica]
MVVRGYIAEHPNDEEEVEGIYLHQQRYPGEGSDMDYLYDESSFAQLLSMKLTLKIDGAIFHVPNANANSNVDSQLLHAKITMQWVLTTKASHLMIVNEKYKQGTYVSLRLTRHVAVFADPMIPLLRFTCSVLT